MQNMPSSIVNMYQNQLEASRQFADAIFTGTEKIDRVVIDATHRAVTEQLEFAQALAGARDQRTLANIPSSFMPRTENAVNYQKEILQVFAEIQADIGKSIQQYVDQMGSAASEGMSRGADAAQRAEDAFSPASFNPMTGMITVWQSAFKQVADLANRNMQVARANFENAANSASSVAAQAAENIGGAADEAQAAHRKSASGKRK